MPRDKANWLENLRSSDSRHAGALDDLRAMIVRSLPLALSRWLPLTTPACRRWPTKWQKK